MEADKAGICSGAALAAGLQCCPIPLTACLKEDEVQYSDSLRLDCLQEPSR